MRIGLDVGGTKTLAVAVAADDSIVAQARLRTGRGPDAVVSGIVEAVRQVREAAGAGPVRSVGVGIPGQVDRGRVTHALNLGIDDLDLVAALAPRLGAPPAVENDVRAAALGAYTLRGRAGSLAYLNLGTGVAAGIVSDGRVWRGARGAAGEVGHISIDPAGPTCRCGQRGCIEAFAGGASLARRWRRPGDVPVQDLFDTADAGDPDASAIRTGIVCAVASAAQVLILTADVDVVVLGGGLTGLGERLAAPVRAELNSRAGASDFLRSLRLDGRVTLLPVGSPAAALGAALVGAASAPEEVFGHG
ncbi:ROK family protein [Microbacterium sp. zg-YB36]|uniref:ROK family protein n=1 Tax=Microbacterium sp. zg-YB36 TaxID=2969407 RepID=UPI00214B923C|nr:ROK family protein [Microbacterium sp. zg-YB36]MDL5352479.1 ROK family protein [Microbacterium sp. zg-YB36]